MAAGADTSLRYSSSPGLLSSPPSGSISDPASPSKVAKGKRNAEMDEIVVGTNSASKAGAGQQERPVQLTAAGLPRKKPGRKPGSTVKPKSSDGTEAPKVRKPRKPRDPNAPPIQRKRKSAPAGDIASGSETKSPRLSAAGSTSSRQQKITDLASMKSESRVSSAQLDSAPQSPPRREAIPSSMQSILNADPPSPSQPSNTTTLSMRTSGQSYDPIRGNYDPVRETMISRDPYGTSAAGSPRAPTQVINRASASPSIASLVDPPVAAIVSPVPSHQSFHAGTTAPSRVQPQESTSLPPSPSHPPRAPPIAVAKSAASETKKAPPPPPAPVAKSEPKSKEANTGSVNGLVKKPSPKQKPNTAASSPKTNGIDDLAPAIVNDRSILDFGKAQPGEEYHAPSIVLHIPIKEGETNKYVNFLRMAEENYGWDALHPRLAAHRDRKARIAAASAALEKTGSGRETDDEMSVDLSDAEGSNAEMGGTSGPEVQGKPKKKKRNFKEDEYDREDDFVDDSELLWEEQAAASRDGFFVYSGPLIPEEEKPAGGKYVAILPLVITSSFLKPFANLYCFSQARWSSKAGTWWQGESRWWQRCIDPRWCWYWAWRWPGFSRRIYHAET
jgi:hypothetical protein